MASNRAAWDRTASKFASELGADVERLRSGGTSLLPIELDELAPLIGECRRAIHLQCSHGQDALSLWQAGIPEVVGVDFSGQMLDLARRKAEMLGASVTFHESDVLDPPAELVGWADLVYTGKGALPWLPDLNAWAEVVARLLAPGGHLYVFEGHPLNWVWDSEAAKIALQPNARYFEAEPRRNREFPAKYLERATEPGQAVEAAFERQWTLGDVVSAVASAGLRVVRLTEHPDEFWPQFYRLDPGELARLPRSFSLLAERAR
jgi:SAM-dependent methyltransferase